MKEFKIKRDVTNKINENKDLIEYTLITNPSNKYSLSVFQWVINLLKTNHYIILEQKLTPIFLLIRAKKDQTKNSYDDIKNNSKLTKLKNKIFIVTGAVAGAPVFNKFLKSIESFCNHHKAELYILPVRSHAQAFESQEPLYDKELNVYINNNKFVKSIIFNNNIQAIDIQNNPQKMSPLANIHNFESSMQGTSLLIAAPSLDFKTLPRGNHGTHPHIAACSGVITKPNYQKNEIGLIATTKHKMGCTVIECINDKQFFMRQCEAISDGSFVCLGKRYFPNGEIKIEQVHDILLGDPHIGMHDDLAWKASMEQITYFKPETVRAGDFDSADEISPWGRKDTIQAYHTAQLEHFKTLKNQKENIIKFLKELLSKSPNSKFEFVPSNHTTDWLYRGVMGANFSNFPIEDRITLMKVYIGLCEDKEKTVEELLYGKLDRVIYRKRTEDVVFKGIQLNAHGDVGIKGSKGSPSQYRKIYKAMNHGHCHDPYRYGDIMAAGTHIKQPDHDPIRSQLNANIITYECGTREMIITIGGQWK